MAFDIEGARKEGYSDAEIADFMAAQSGFDVAGARKEGYTDADIIAALAAPPAVPDAAAARAARIEALKRSDPGQYDPESPEWKARFGATSGMSTLDKIRANVGAGMMDLWLGGKQLLTPEKRGVTSLVTGRTEIEQEIADKRKRDEELAKSITGGKALQIAGNVIPTLAIPGGAVVRGASLVPRLGALASRVGIGTRVLPTMMAEGSVLGGALGALQPTDAGESTLANMGVGAGLGLGVPLGLQGLGALWRNIPGALFRGPLARREVERGLMRDIEGTAETSAAKATAVSEAERELQRYAARSPDEPPMSTAMVTQNPQLAERELVARGAEETSKQFAKFDEILDDARWDVLDKNLADAKSVKAAKDATDKFADSVVPQFFAFVQKPRFTRARQQFAKHVDDRLKDPEVIADPAKKVYTYLASTKKALDEVETGWTPEAMWSARRALAKWMDGTPPSGVPEVRAENQDRYILDAMKEIDKALNASSNKKWTPFLQSLAKRLKEEAAQKAGANIRNAFVDEALTTSRVPTTAAGKPRVTEAALRRAFSKFGTDQFGRVMKPEQEKAVRNVVGNLEAQGVLQRAKSTMTGRGGPQTAMMAARLFGNVTRFPMLNDLLRLQAKYAKGPQREMLTRALVDPEYALQLLQGAQRQMRPLTPAELALVSRAGRAAPAIAEAAEDEAP